MLVELSFEMLPVFGAFMHDELRKVLEVVALLVFVRGSFDKEFHERVDIDLAVRRASIALRAPSAVQLSSG